MDLIDINTLPPQKRLFNYMHQGLAKAKKIGQHVIFLIGESRSGKSTTFNWITNPLCLIGKGNELSSQYVLIDENEYAALMKKTYVSITLVQNKHQIQDGANKALLIDLPGFHDSRSVNEVMLVNFIIDCCFSHSKKAKFIIVVSKEDFWSSKGDGFINTLQEFVKFFREFPEDQRRKIYKAASMLVTAVDVKSYDSYKEMYLLQLNQNLNHIKELSKKNEETKKYVNHMVELLLQIINSKRLELFQAAKDEKCPQKSQIIQQFNTCDWLYYNLEERILDITYPYNEYYKRLSQEDKQKIDWQIVNKVKQFERLQDMFARVIEEYLKQPYNKAIDFSEIFNEIQQFANRNRVHNDELQAPEEDLIQEQQELKPLKIYRNIQILINLTFEVQDNGCRPIQQQRSVNYFEYLLPFFKKTIKIFGDSFALSQQNRQTMRKIMGIFGQVIQELKYITQISASLKSKCSYDLKQALMVMNKVYCLKEDLPKPFLKDLLKEEFESYAIKQLQETIGFLQGFQWEKLDLRVKFYLLSKCQKDMVKLQRSEKSYYQAVQYAISSLENFMKYQYAHQIHKSLRKTTQEQFRCYTTFQELSKELIEQVFISLFLSGNEQILKLLGYYSLFSVVKQSMAQLQKGKQKSQITSILQRYAKFYQEHDHYELEIAIYKRLVKAQKWKARELQQIQQNQRRAETRFKTSYIQHKPQIQSSFFKDEAEVLQFINKIGVSILTKEIPLQKEKMMEQVGRYYKERNIQANPNEFDYKISNDPSYFDILNVSQMLVNMIKNRKVVLMLGRRSGKTSAYYWLMKKPLTIKRIGNRKYVYDLNCANIKNRINHKGFHPTYIPNIGQFQPGELLIDFSNMFHKKVIHVMLQLNILQEIFKNSQSVKFLLVCRQEEVLKDDCSYLFKIIEFCLSFMPTKERICQHFALLITHYENTKKEKDGLNDFLEQFQTINHKYDFEQKYKIKIKDKKYYKDILSSFSQNKTILFPKADKDIPECNFTSFTNQPNWAYVQSPKNTKADLFSYMKLLDQQNNQINQGAQLVQRHIQKIRDILNGLGCIFQNSVDDWDISRQIHLWTSQSFRNNWKYQPLVSYQEYPQLYHYNQIFAILKLTKFFRCLQSFTTTIREGRQNILELFRLLKNLSFRNGQGMMLLTQFETKFIQLIMPLSIVEEFKIERLNYVISELKNMVTWLTWANYYIDLFGKNMEKNMRNINVQELVKQMAENNWKINQNLIKFIKVCFEIQQQKKLYIFVQGSLGEKLNSFVRMLKQSAYLQQNHKNSLEACIVLFQLENRNFQAAFHNFQQAQGNNQEQIEFKIKLLDILKEMAVILANLDEEIALSICEKLQCHDCKCHVFDRILANNKKRDEVLEKYLEFCLQIGLKNEYIEQCNKIAAIPGHQQMKEKYNTIKYDILNGKRQLINKKKTAYDNLKDIKIQHLREIFEVIKGYWSKCNIS